MREVWCPSNIQIFTAPSQDGVGTKEVKMRIYISEERITSLVAFCALFMACDSVVHFLTTIVAIIALLVCQVIVTQLWRYHKPNLKGCGARLDVGSQWRLDCGDVPPDHPNAALCRTCDPRHGTKELT